MTIKQTGNSRSGTALPEETPAEPLAIIPKGKTRCIVVRLATFKGVTRLDIREHYKGDNGEWAPTKSGITLPADERVGLLIDAIPARVVTESGEVHRIGRYVLMTTAIQRGAA